MRSDSTLPGPMVFFETDGPDGLVKTASWKVDNSDTGKRYHGITFDQRARLDECTAEENATAVKGTSSEKAAGTEVTRAEYVISIPV